MLHNFLGLIFVLIVGGAICLGVKKAPFIDEGWKSVIIWIIIIFAGVIGLIFLGGVLGVHTGLHLD